MRLDFAMLIRSGLQEDPKIPGEGLRTEGAEGAMLENRLLKRKEKEKKKGS